MVQVISDGGMMLELRVEVVQGSLMNVVIETRHGPGEAEVA